MYELLQLIRLLNLRDEAGYRKGRHSFSVFRDDLIVTGAFRSWMLPGTSKPDDLDSSFYTKTPPGSGGLFDMLVKEEKSLGVKFMPLPNPPNHEPCPVGERGRRCPVSLPRRRQTPMR